MPWSACFKLYSKNGQEVPFLLKKTIKVDQPLLFYFIKEYGLLQCTEEGEYTWDSQKKCIFGNDHCKLLYYKHDLKYKHLKIKAILLILIKIKKKKES